MSDREHPFDSGRPRPLVTVLDTLRARIDQDSFDAAIFSSGSAPADGPTQPAPGSCSTT